MTGIKATVGPLTKCSRNTRLKRNEHITAGSWKWRKAHLHPSFSPLAEAWGKRLKLSIRESQHSYQTKGEHPIVIRFLTYAENSASQSSAQPSPPSEDTEEEQSNGATTRTATSTSYQDGLVICVDIMFIFSNCIVYNNFTLWPLGAVPWKKNNRRITRYDYEVMPDLILPWSRFYIDI